MDSDRPEMNRSVVAHVLGDMTEALPRPGDVVHVGGAASVQFQGERALTLRVIRVDPRLTYDGWLWIEGYVLDLAGDAIGRRRVFVRRDGLIQR